MQIIKSESNEPVNVPYQMNQTEQIAVASTATHHQDKSKKAFAPASELVNRINIDFRKLQSFKGKCLSHHHLQHSIILRVE